MEKAGFIDRLGRENVCPHVDAALDRARELLGLPPAPPTDPLHGERQKLESARKELTSALERAHKALNLSVKSASAQSPSSDKNDNRPKSDG
jgi:SulP family sulfate permease